jgi:hypothetical protein
MAEQWFFRKYVELFRKEIGGDRGRIGEADLFKEINLIPEQYQPAVVKGIGMLVGSEMLFDTLHVPDYPLDSRFGEKFDDPLQVAFYEGVGSGFAETLCRFWRMLLLPDDLTSPQYRMMLDIEWNRCHALMTMLPQSYYPFIKRGFVEALKTKHVKPGIRDYVHNKLENNSQ